MAPKKQIARAKTKGSSGGVGAKSVAQLKISAENEARVRRLLQNRGPSNVPAIASNVPATEVGVEADISEGEKRQVERRLRHVYDNLQNEGFTDSQIQMVLTALHPGGVNLESALDWLCLNLPTNDLPLKFSTGFHVDQPEGGAIQVLGVAQPEGGLGNRPLEKLEESFADYIKLDSIRKEQNNADLQAEQADWIRQYMAQQEEEAESHPECPDDLDWEEKDGKHWESTSRANRPKQIVEDFLAAKQAALEGKRNGDKQKQAAAGQMIRNLKEEMIFLGLSSSILLSTNDIQVDMSANSYNVEQLAATNMAMIQNEEEGTLANTSAVCHVGLEVNGTEAILKQAMDEEEGMESLFSEDAIGPTTLPESITTLQKMNKIMKSGVDVPEQAYAKKGTKSSQEKDTTRHPMALLQQYCQKNKWGAPKYEKISERGDKYTYIVTVMRPSSGRGKSRISGGPFTCKLPDGEDTFDTIEEAQNTIATYALHSLFPEMSLHQLLPEPYHSLSIQWNLKGKASQRKQIGDAITRDNFIKTLVESSGGFASRDSGAPIKEELMPSHGLRGPLKQDRRYGKGRDSCHLKVTLENRQATDQYKEMLDIRESLPIASVKRNFLKLLDCNDVVVVCGETGSGKTTQIPQYMLDNMILAGDGELCNIICTQPRRIAAISIAERVASERCEPPPGRKGSLVGYQVRLESSWNPETRLLFCTTGILLRKLAGDSLLQDVSHVIVDEVHERTVLGDFLMIILKDLMERRRQLKMSPLKVILMSATLDSKLFSSYFGDCPVVCAEGRTYPVSRYYLEDVYEQVGYQLSSDSPASISSKYTSRNKILTNLADSSRGRQNLVSSGWGDVTTLEEIPLNPHYEDLRYSGYSSNTKKNLAKLNEDMIDYDLLEDLIIYIDTTHGNGAILVFLPGMAEIQLIFDRLMASRRFSGAASDWLLPLHSSLAPKDQKRVFEIPPLGVRKVVLSTNIAETSLTIEDVVHVIDCGKHKENRYDPQRSMSQMMEAWISQANARQRSGRAGRIQPGNCFCLYTLHRFEKLMHPFQLPEMLRVPLVELCLQIKLLAVGNIMAFLEKAVDPPKYNAVENAMCTLREVGALDKDEKLTSLGYHLAALPVDVHIGKMMLYGAIFRCLDPVLTIAACLGHKSPFISLANERDGACRSKLAIASERSTVITGFNVASKQQSDHLVMVAAYDGWCRILKQRGSKAAHQFCDSKFLSMPTLLMLRDIRTQFATLLEDIGFIEFPEGTNSRTTKDMDACLIDMAMDFNSNSQNASVIKAVLSAGLYPNVASMSEDSIIAGHASALSQRAGLASDRRPHWYDGSREVFIHPSSVNHSIVEFRHPFLVFHEKMETTRVFLRDTTVVSPYAILLFGGPITVQHQTGHVIVDGWLHMDAPAQVGVLFKELRLALENVLQELITIPKKSTLVPLEHMSTLKEILPSITKLLSDEERPVL